MLLWEGQRSDSKCAAPMIGAFPNARSLLADRGGEAGRFRAALAIRAITACIPSRVKRKQPILHDPAL